MVSKKMSLAYLGKGVRLFIPHTFGGDECNIWTGLWNWLAKECPTLSIFEQRVTLPLNKKPFWDFIKRHKCETIMEIGLGNGKNMKKILNMMGDDCDYYCFDNLFWDYSRRVMQEFEGRKNVHFYIGDTRETLPAAVGKLPLMDFIFVDGGHSLPVVSSDWKYCKKLMHSKTAVFFHDYDCADGVKRVVDNIDDGFSVRIIESKIGPHFALVRRSSDGQ